LKDLKEKGVVKDYNVDFKRLCSYLTVPNAYLRGEFSANNANNFIILTPDLFKKLFTFKKNVFPLLFFILRRTVGWDRDLYQFNTQTILRTLTKNGRILDKRIFEKTIEFLESLDIIRVDKTNSTLLLMPGFVVNSKKKEEKIKNNYDKKSKSPLIEQHLKNWGLEYGEQI
jgi:hypothetical protein